MKSKLIFFTRLSIIGSVVFAVAATKSTLSYYDGSYKSEVNGREVYLSIDKSIASVPNARTVILGDSVAKQLYDNKKYNGEYYSLACNVCITMAGNYVLINRFIENNKGQLEKVYLIYTPGSFSLGLYDKYTYQYFTKPFYNNDHVNLLDYNTLAVINKNPFSAISQWPFIKASNINFGIYYDDVKDYTVSAEYLLKIKKLCQDNKIIFRVLPPFLKKSSYEKYDYTDLLNMIREYRLEDVFDGYVQNIKLVDDGHFRDSAHYKDPRVFGDDPLGILRH